VGKRKKRQEKSKGMALLQIYQSMRLWDNSQVPLLRQKISFISVDS